jgi:hypothetical protein
MPNNFQRQLSEMGQKMIGYLPNLLGGLLLILLGWIIGWIIKRIIIQLLVILRFDRLFIRLRWKSSLSKADLRYALYNLIGNAAFFIVFLLFLNSALTVLKLEILSRLIEQGVLFVPRLIVGLMILGIGWLIAARTANAVYYSLLKENVPRGSLVARLIKFIIIIFFSAMALVELNIAKEVVIIGFAAIVLTLSISTVVVVFTGRETLKDFFNKDKSEGP